MTSIEQPVSSVQHQGRKLFLVFFQLDDGLVPVVPAASANPVRLAGLFAVGAEALARCRQSEMGAPFSLARFRDFLLWERHLSAVVLTGWRFRKARILSAALPLSNLYKLNKLMTNY